MEVCSVSIAIYFINLPRVKESALFGLFRFLSSLLKRCFGHFFVLFCLYQNVKYWCRGILRATAAPLFFPAVETSARQFFFLLCSVSLRVWVQVYFPGRGRQAPNKRSLGTCVFCLAPDRPLMFIKRNVWKSARSQGPLQNKPGINNDPQLQRRTRKAIPFRNMLYDRVWRDTTRM